MHPNRAFRKSSDTRNIRFAREQGFGVLCVTTGDVPLVSHVPFLLSEDGGQVELHLVKSNPIARSLSAPLRARLAVQGPHSYVSPDWYDVADQVPTWNYVAVHLQGTLELRPQEEMYDLLDRQSELFEAKLAPKRPWIAGKMTEGVMEAMTRQIVPCRMKVDKIDGTWKLNQNKPDDVRLRAADAVEEHGLGAGTDILAALMRNPEEDHP
ncbi:MAG: FMN-binding negative transcriptional regulator [Pseudomonadota bacterium]